MLSDEPGQHPNLVYLTDIIPSALEGATQNAALVGVTLTQSCAECLPPIMGDSKRTFSRALAHLLDNAIKFNSPGGTVVVAACQEKQNIVLEVTDSGVGIPATALDQIRESFSQFDLRLGRRYEGTGLGLAYVARVQNYMVHEFRNRQRAWEGNAHPNRVCSNGSCPSAGGSMKRYFVRPHRPYTSILFHRNSDCSPCIGPCRYPSGADASFCWSLNARWVDAQRWCLHLHWTRWSGSRHAGECSRRL